MCVPTEVISYGLEEGVTSCSLGRGVVTSSKAGETLYMSIPPLQMYTPNQQLPWTLEPLFKKSCHTGNPLMPDSGGDAKRCNADFDVSTVVKMKGTK